jgi:hypothetical protein
MCHRNPGARFGHTVQVSEVTRPSALFMPDHGAVLVTTEDHSAVLMTTEDGGLGLAVIQQSKL